MSNHSSWSSKIGFVLAAAGSAIGLGAIWKFPYTAGTNGGAVFFSFVFDFYDFGRLTGSIGRVLHRPHGAVKTPSILSKHCAPVRSGRGLAAWA